MTTITDNGGPAFPVVELNQQTGHPNAQHFGATLRDYMASQALAGLCANPGGPFQSSDRNGWDLVNCTTDDVAKTAFALADAMLKVRNQ